MSIKRKIIFSFVLCFLVFGIKAQQVPQYTQYLFNHFAINPAVAGSKNCLDAKLGVRLQWVGFDGAPRTGFGSLHSVLKRNRFGLDNKHAMGIYVENDTYGQFGRAKIKLAYAYHFPVANEVLMSFGLFAGVEQFRFKASDVTLANFNDQAITGNQTSFIAPLIEPGIFLQSEDLFGGISLHQTLGSTVPNFGFEANKLKQHFMLLGGKKFMTKKEKWSFIPSFLMKITPAVPIALDVNMMVDYENRFSFGFSYRNVDAVAVLVKFNLLNYFTLGYSFDYTLSKIQLASNNTHEVILGINPCGNKKKGKYACPTFN